MAESVVHAQISTDSHRRIYKPILPTYGFTVMILPQVHLRKPCYDFYFL